MDIDFPIFGAIYCIMIIIIGQFFLLNLILAVIIQAFMKAHQEQVESEIKDLEEEQLQLESDPVTQYSEENSQIEESKYDSRGSDDRLIHGQTLKTPVQRDQRDSFKRVFSQNSEILEEDEMSESLFENNDFDLDPSDLINGKIPSGKQNSGKLSKLGRQTQQQLGRIFDDKKSQPFSPINKKSKFFDSFILCSGSEAQRGQ